MKTEFIWTEDLIRELLYDKFFCPWNRITERMEAFKTEKHRPPRKEQDYEILPTYGGYGIDKDGKRIIAKVLRVADGETFEIGDRVYFKNLGSPSWNIDHFFLRDDGKLLARSKDCAMVEYVDAACDLMKLYSAPARDCPRCKTLLT